MRDAFRVSGTAVAAAIVAAAWRSSYCRTVEGDLSGRFILGFALALAAVLTAWTAASRWARFGLWLSLALAGQAAALQLIDAGPLIHYQHYKLPPDAMADPALRWPLLLVALQAAAVAGGLAARREAIIAWARGRGRVLPLLAVAAASVCFAAAVSRDVRFFVCELGFAALVQLVNAANVLLAAWALPANGLEALARRFDSWLRGDERGRVSLDRFAWSAALWVTVVAAALAWFVYERHPHVADEVVYLYNARYFAAGKLTMAPPPVPAAFEVDLMDNQADKWFSAVPVGWPAVLTIGAVLRVSWLVDPVLGGINVLLVYLLLGEIYSRRIARISTLLLCASPWYLFLAMSYMTHILTLTCSLLAFLGVARSQRTGLVRWAWLAGFGAGACSLVRPLDGLIVGVLVAAWALGLGGARLKLKALTALAAGTLLTGALALPYNKALTGSATRSPLTDYSAKHYGPKTNDYGFGPERGQGWPIDPYPGHTPFEAVILAELNGASLNTDLFGWSTGSLCLLAALVLVGSKHRSDYLMLTAMAVIVLAYAPYWTNGGPDFGARYWFLMFVPCVALSARGLEWMEIKLGPSGRNDTRATAAIVMLCGLGLAVYIPWRSLDKYRHYLRMRPDVRTLAQQHRFGGSLVFIRGERFPDYASAVIYNPINLRDDVPIYVWDHDARASADVLSVYPDRPVWIVDGPSATHAGYRVAAGPLSPESRLP